MLEMRVIDYLTILLKSDDDLKNIEEFLNKCDLTVKDYKDPLKTEKELYEKIIQLIEEFGLINILNILELLSQKLKNLDQSKLDNISRANLQILIIECPVFYERIERFLYSKVYCALIIILPSMDSMPIDEAVLIFRKMVLRDKITKERNVFELDQLSLFSEEKNFKKESISVYQIIREELTIEEEAIKKLFSIMSNEEINNCLFKLVEKINKDRKVESLILTKVLISVGNRITPPKTRTRSKEVVNQIGLFN